MPATLILRFNVSIDGTLTASLDWASITNKAATSTILAALDSDYRIAHLNASTTIISAGTTTDS